MKRSESRSVTMLVTVRCPLTLPAAAARREVRSLIAEQAFFGARFTSGPWETDFIGPESLKLISIKPGPQTRKPATKSE